MFWCEHHGGNVEGEPAYTTMSIVLNEDHICTDCAIYYRVCAECNEPALESTVETVGEDVVCDECLALFFECFDCGEHYRNDEERNAGPDGEYYCYDCYEGTWTTCDGCSGTVRQDELEASGDGEFCPAWFCPACYEEEEEEEEEADHRVDVLGHENVEYSILAGSSHDTSLTVGVEIEVCFDNCPYLKHGYQFRDGFSGWDSREEPTVCGVEIVSPILRGAEGIAEIIATAAVLSNAGGYMDDSTGQHTTVGHTGADSTFGSKVDDLFYTYEEALFAITGNWGRYETTGYGGSMKGGSGNGLRQRYNKPATEFRYPPGTLDPTQIALNIGACSLMSNAAKEMTVDETQEHRGRTNHNAAHQLEKSLEFFEDFGWKKNYGLPYDVDDPPTIQISDGVQDIVRKVTLPNRAALKATAEENINVFRNQTAPPVFA